MGVSSFGAASVSLAALLSIQALAAAVAGAQTLRVAPTGANTPGCGAEGSPCRTIQFAVDEIASAGTVLVAGSAGGARYTYESATETCAGPLGMTGIVCVINKQVAIRGGFSTSDWASPAPDVNQTVIDGQSLHRGVLVTSTGPPTRLELEGFTIEHCRGEWSPARPGLDSIFAFGGGLFADSVQHVVLRDLIFRDNLAIGKDVTSESDFGGNGAGGGVALRLVDDALLHDLTFERNTARGGTGPARPGYGSGGGLFTNESTVVGRGLRFVDNLARAGDSPGNGLGSDGERAAAFGGAADFQEGSEVLLEQVTAIGNSATAGTTATLGSGAFGGAFKAEIADVTMIDVEMRDNEAIAGDAANGGYGAGGGLEAIHSAVALVRATVVGNLARGGDGNSGDQGPAGGGGINVAWVAGAKDSTLTLVNSVVADNSVEQGGGTNVTGGGGGGLFISGATAILQHTTVAGNQASPSMAGQAILLIESSAGSPTARPASAILQHSIIADHTGFPSWQMAALHVRPGNSAVLQSGLLANNSHDTNADGVPAPSGALTGLETTSAAASAQFVAPGPPTSDYHLTPDSPARDLAGGSAAEVDIDGDARTRSGPPDAGADEYVPAAGSGAIAGVVSDSEGGAAIAVSVAAFDATTQLLVAKRLTDATGAYEIPGLPPGLYHVRFGMNEGPGGYIGEWHAGATGPDMAAALAVEDGGTAFADAILDPAGTCHGFTPTLVGSIGPDVLVGGTGRDVVVGGPGADEIKGRGGDDALCGGGGADVIAGGGGDDYLNGGAGGDGLSGGAGNDVLRDRGGDDRLRGGRGNDDLRDPKGENTLVGGAGSDRCNARTGNTLTGCEQ
jgi:RTX calcium-binding nonapeptide repeat (4 copies)